MSEVQKKGNQEWISHESGVVVVSSDQCYTPKEIRTRVQAVLSEAAPDEKAFDFCSSQASAALLDPDLWAADPNQNFFEVRLVDMVDKLASFINPPFSARAGSVKKFVEHYLKLVDQSGGVGIILLNADTSTSAWHQATEASEITLLGSKRWSFGSPESVTEAYNPDANIVWRNQNRMGQSLHLICPSLKWAERKKARLAFVEQFGELGLLIESLG